MTAAWMSQLNSQLSRTVFFGFLLTMLETRIFGQRIRGVLAPVVTPFKADLSPDRERFIRHCQWLLSQSCGLAVFGTNSEANSMAAEERSTLLDVLVAAGDPNALRKTSALLHHANTTMTERYLGLNSESVAVTQTLRGQDFLGKLVGDSP